MKDPSTNVEYWREIDEEVLEAIRYCANLGMPLGSTEAVLNIVRSRRPEWAIPSADIRMGLLRQLESGFVTVNSNWHYEVVEKPDTSFQYLGG